ncbi:MAG: efflux RND transporter periplasmic adaptor subunit [Magnetococcales bacterium]|nr:efflux RND transporter periplasmic adaptor subunit [Magnetococcales bacterium]
MNKSLFSATAILLLLAAWMLSGPDKEVSASPPSAKKSEEKAEKPPMRVKTHLSKGVEMEQFVQVKGQVEPLRSVTIRVETQGRVTQLPVKKGDRVQAGANLAQLSLNDRSARLSEARFLVSQEERNLAATKKLVENRVKTTNQLKVDETNLAAARSRLQQILWEIDNTTIKAPFSGVLNERPVELGAFLQVGDPVGTLVDDSTLLLTAQAPQLAVLQLQPGQAVQATLVNGVVLEGKLSYLSAMAEKGTRSYRIEARVDNPGHLPYTGLSATLELPVGQTVAHKVSPSTLGLDTLGRLIVKGVDEDDRVVVMPVELLRRERDGMWVSGLPTTFQLIILGQEYLSSGEKVQTQLDERS